MPPTRKPPMLAIQKPSISAAAAALTALVAAGCGLTDGPSSGATLTSEAQPRCKFDKETCENVDIVLLHKPMLNRIYADQQGTLRNGNEYDLLDSEWAVLSDFSCAPNTTSDAAAVCLAKELDEQLQAPVRADVSMHEVERQAVETHLSMGVVQTHGGLGDHAQRESLK